jgi:uncharacterized membrane protein YgcG
MINWLKKMLGIKPPNRGLTRKEVLKAYNNRLKPLPASYYYRERAKGATATRANYSDNSGNSYSFDLPDLSEISTSGYSHVSDTDSGNSKSDFDYGGGSFGGSGAGSDWGSDSSSSFDSGSSSSSDDW